MSEIPAAQVRLLLDHVHAGAREHAPLIALRASSRNDETRDRLLFEAAWPGRDSGKRLELRLTPKEGNLQLLAVGRDGEQRRLLRNVLVSRARLMAEPLEHLILEEFNTLPRPKQMLNRIAGWIQTVQHLVSTWDKVTHGEMEAPDDSALVFWWDGKANFGDAAGPWLVEQMTGKSAINVRTTQAQGRALSSIGSLFQMMSHQQVDFWGSGMLYEPNEMQTRRLQNLESVNVHAVRGKISREVLMKKFGWDIPEVYGDPALLFPRYLMPEQPREDNRIAFIPHRQHMKYFKSRDLGNVTLLSVAEDLKDVVTSIATAGVCVSTSLHGIIFAQAYGTPWVWLNVQDDELKGGEFKFDDFFTTLDKEAVARVDAKTEALRSLDIEEVASQASLPETAIDLELLEKAFPLTRKSPGERMLHPERFSWEGIPKEARIVAHVRAAYRRRARLQGGGRREWETAARSIEARDTRELVEKARTSTEIRLGMTRDWITGLSSGQIPTPTQEAWDALKHAEEHAHNEPSLQHEIAVAYLQLGDAEAGKKHLEASAAHDHPPTDALMKLAELYREEARFDDAMTLLERVLAQEPGHERACSRIISVGARGSMDWPRIWRAVKRLEPRKTGSSPYRNPQFRRQLDQFFSPGQAPGAQEAGELVVALEKMAGDGRNLRAITLGLIIIRLQFLGHFSDGFILRDRQARRNVEYLTRKPVGSLGSLRRLMKAYCYLGEPHQAVECAENVSWEGKGPELQQKLRKLKADALLLAGEAEPYIEYSKAARQITPLTGDAETEALVKGKRVAVVGPADTGDMLGQAIDEYDVVVRPRYNPGFLDTHREAMGSRTDIAYYSGHDLEEFLDVARQAVEAGDLKVVNTRPFTYRKYHRLQLPWLRFYRHDFSLCYSGAQLGIQRMVYDLLQFEPSEICIFNSDFYTGSQMFTAGWRPQDSFGPGSHINDIVAAHDIKADFEFTQALMKTGIVTAQGRAAEVLDMTPSEYVNAVEEAGVLR